MLILIYRLYWPKIAQSTFYQPWLENPFPWKSAQISSQNQNHFQVNPQRNYLLLHGTRMLGLGNCKEALNGSLEFQIRNQCEDVCLIITNLHTSLGYITRSCNLFSSWYLKSSFSKWISMGNLIMNVPQTLILFKIACDFSHEKIVGGSSHWRSQWLLPLTIFAWLKS